MLLSSFLNLIPEGDRSIWEDAPLGRIASQSTPPPHEAGALVLHLTARYLDREGNIEQRQWDVPEFRSRAVYEYFGVPATVHEALLLAPSIGACFNEIVRGCYAYCRVTATGSDCLPKGTL